jgi:hypothetical protein
VRVGESIVLQSEVRDASGNVLTDRVVTWTSSANGVATVTATGQVAAVAPGQAIITATSELKTGTATINVPAPVADVVLDAPEFVQIGQSVFVNARAVSSTGATLQRPITYSTSNLAILGVSGSGQVSGLAPGTAVITATAEGKNKDVTMTATPVASVSMVYPNYYIPMVANVQLDLEAKNSTGGVVTGLSTRTWSSSVSSTSVSATGVLRSNDFGLSTVTGRWDGQQATQEFFAMEPLLNDQPITGIGSNVIAQQYGFVVIVPPPPSRLVLTIRGPNGDADLLLGRPTKTQESMLECAPFLDDSNETCDVENLPAGYYVVIIRTFASYSNLELKAVITTPAASTSTMPVYSAGVREFPLDRPAPSSAFSKRK